MWRGGEELLCHLILLAPLFSLVLFFVYPVEFALPIYLIILLLSFLFYRKIMDSMRRPIKTGFEEMIGSPAAVVEHINPEGRILYKGELWLATSKERLEKGERAVIVGREGMILQVKREC
jgi:membrane-bound serine protease (ClpP class)